MIFNAILLAAAALLVGLAEGQRTQSIWGQCGGSQYSGPTNCAQGSWCSYGNDYYYQCVPGTAVQDVPYEQETGTPDEPFNPDDPYNEGEPTEEEPAEEEQEQEEPTPIIIIPTRTTFRGPFPTVTRTIFNPLPTGPSRGGGGGGGSASVIVIGGRTYSLVVPAPTARPGGEEEEEGEVEEGEDGGEDEGGEDEGEEYGEDGAPAAKGKGSAAGVKMRRFMAR